ncbi:MAG: hypothetical protein IGS48_17625 [Oscillatoriales cyanobacterium C42_A2020_001]|nr:hypothetical protein [Leptolyngbyaceae cyanobacterium C42_A2020_001]
MKTLIASISGAIATLFLAAPSTANPIYLPNNTVQIYSYPTRRLPVAYPRYSVFGQPYQLPPSRPTPVLPGPTLIPVPSSSKVPIITYPSVQFYPQTRSIYQHPVQHYPIYSRPRSTIYRIYVVPGN